MGFQSGDKMKVKINDNVIVHIGGTMRITGRVVDFSKHLNLVVVSFDEDIRGRNGETIRHIAIHEDLLSVIVPK